MLGMGGGLGPQNCMGGDQAWLKCVGERGGAHGAQCRCFLRRALWQVSSPTPPGIDKLTEKSQVSEDGTLRSLEPMSQQSSAEGSPAAEVGDGDSCSGVTLGLPFFPGLCHWAGPGHSGVPCSRGQEPCAQDMRGAAFTDFSLVYRSQASLAFRLLIHQPYLRGAGLYPTSPVSPWP